jgi:hypothetical protein
MKLHALKSCLLIAAPLLMPLCSAHAAGGHDLDVTIRMIDRRNANVDRFMNRIQLPSDRAEAAADRPDRRTATAADGARGATDDAIEAGDAVADRPDDGRADHDRSRRERTERRQAADINGEARDISRQSRRDFDDIRDDSRRDPRSDRQFRRD